MSSTKHVAVIGGGILGVSTAVHLLRQGASVTLLSEQGLAQLPRQIGTIEKIDGQKLPRTHVRA